MAVASHWVVMADGMKRCAYCHNADVTFWGRCPSCGKPRTSAAVKISIIVGVPVAIYLLFGPIRETGILPAWVYEPVDY